MQLIISHVSVRENNLIEVGAFVHGRENWRASIAEAVARIRAGVRFFVEFQGKLVPVEVVPSTLLRDPTLRTQADKTTFQLLKALPQLPQLPKVSAALW